MKANDLYRTERGICLFGRYLFAMSSEPVEPSKVGVCSVHCGTTVHACPNGGIAQKTFLDEQTAHYQAGMANRDLPENFGIVTNERGDVTHYFSPNGRMWEVTFLGVDGGPLATQAFNLAPGAKRA